MATITGVRAYKNYIRLLQEAASSVISMQHDKPFASKPQSRADPHHPEPHHLEPGAASQSQSDAHPHHFEPGAGHDTQNSQVHKILQKIAATPIDVHIFDTDVPVGKTHFIQTDTAAIFPLSIEECTQVKFDDYILSEMRIFLKQGADLGLTTLTAITHTLAWKMHQDLQVLTQLKIQQLTFEKKVEAENTLHGDSDSYKKIMNIFDTSYYNHEKESDDDAHFEERCEGLFEFVSDLHKILTHDLLSGNGFGVGSVNGEESDVQGENHLTEDNDSKIVIMQFLAVLSSLPKTLLNLAVRLKEFKTHILPYLESYMIKNHTENPKRLKFIFNTAVPMIFKDKDRLAFIASSTHDMNSVINIELHNALTHVIGQVKKYKQLKEIIVQKIERDDLHTNVHVV